MFRLSITIISPQVSNGFYNYTFNDSATYFTTANQNGLGIYTVVCNMTLMNYTLSNVAYFNLIINAPAYDFTWTNPANMTITNDDYMLAIGENLTTYVTILNPNAPAPVPASLQLIANLTLNGVNILNNITTKLSSTLYQITIPTASLTADTYVLLIESIYANSAVESHTITIVLINYWNTTIQLPTPPQVYPWGNDVYFTMQYLCSESIRNGFVLPGAAISTLNVSQRINGTFIVVHSFNSSQLNSLWGYTDNNDGTYSVWYNSSVITVSSDNMVFYVMPLIGYSNHTPIYQSISSSNIYLTMNRIKTTLLAFTSPTATIPITGSISDLQLYQSSTIYLHLDVSDSNSVQLGQEIGNASVSYFMTGTRPIPVFLIRDQC